MRSGYIPHNQCLGKLAFISEEVAQRCADKSNALPKNIKKGKQFRVYTCHICGGFHHSTKPGRDRKC